MNWVLIVLIIVLIISILGAIYCIHLIDKAYNDLNHIRTELYEREYIKRDDNIENTIEGSIEKYEKIMDSIAIDTFNDEDFEKYMHTRINDFTTIATPFSWIDRWNRTMIKRREDTKKANNVDNIKNNVLNSLNKKHNNNATLLNYSEKLACMEVDNKIFNNYLNTHANLFKLFGKDKEWIDCKINTIKLYRGMMNKKGE